MINFSNISGNTIVGKILRTMLTIIPHGMIVRIAQGPLKGKKWIKGSGVNGYWLGSYELSEQREMQKHLCAGDVVFDCGAHVGFYSLMAAEIVGECGAVFSFEPLPHNVRFLKKHIALNRYSNVNVMETAVGERDGKANFATSASTFEGRIDDAGDFCVSIARLDTLVVQGICPPPTFIKADIEGGFEALLQGATETIKRFKPTILFESSYLAEPGAFNFLRGVGYMIKPIGTNDFSLASNFIAFIQ